jgi:hypothetical protein
MNRIRWMQRGLLAGLALSFAACATSGGSALQAGASIPYPPPGYAHRIGTSAVELFWNCTRSQVDTLVVEGLAFNPRTASMVRDLEFGLVGVDRRGVTLAETTGVPQDPLLGTMQATNFQLTLRLTGSETRFDLFYRYYSPEEGNPTFSIWPGGRPPVQRVASGPLLKAQMANNFYMVRDACSETQHRAR